MKPEQYYMKWLSTMLSVGTLVATSLVLLGGILFLYVHGQAQFTPQDLIVAKIAHFSWSSFLQPGSIILLGLASLVFTQVLRVSLLVYVYTRIHDATFSLISFFILMVLVYSCLAYI